MARKLIDDELLSLYKQGMLQKDIARHFNVSPVAVCKRLKRLLPAPESILNKHNLTEKERGFVIAKVNGKSNVQAVMNAYEVTSKESAKAMGTKLMDNPEIRQAIDELMEVSGLSRSYRVLKLKEHVDNRDPGISLKALDQTWRLDGSYAPIPVYVDNTREHLQGISERLKDMMSQIKQSVREEVMRELKEKSLLPDDFIDVTEESEKEPVL